MPDAIISRTRTASVTVRKPAALEPLPDDDRLISASLLPQYIGLAFQTLARLRHEGKGPPFIRVGRRIYYRSSDVRRWLDEHTFSSTLYTANSNYISNT